MSKFLLPIGPYHPAIHEPEYFKIIVEGEKVVDVDFSLGFNTREIEALVKRKKWNQAIYLLERVCGICSHHHTTPFVNAVEKLAKIEVPERAKYIRVLIAELERIHSHLLCNGVNAHNIGFDTLFMLFWKARETILELFEEISGNRILHGINTFSGVRRDISEQMKKHIAKKLKEVEKRANELYEIMRTDKLVGKRMRGIGVLKKKDALSLGAVGPVLRSTGFVWDVRKERKYEAYKDIDFKIISEKEGDILSRNIIRCKEVLESLYIIRQVLDKMPEGKTKTIKLLTKVPDGEASFSVEAPRGENFYYVISSGKGVEMVRIRTPTYASMLCLRPMLAGCTIADITPIVLSLDPCFACLDRITVIDEKGDAYKLD